jgi:hypothetical protein
MLDKPEIIAKECKFAISIPSRFSDQPDLHLVKERIHYSDGTTSPNIKIIENFQRPFYLTKRQYQDHKEKKECETIDKLDKYNCTQSELRYKLAKALGKSGSRESIKELCLSPYVYGVDISSTTLIKQAYREKYPTAQSAYDVAIFDTETDVLYGTGDVIMASAVFKNEVFLCIRSDFIKGFANPMDLIQNKFKFYLEEYIVALNLKLTVRFFDTSFEIVRSCFKKFHEWKPDFVAIWNLDFDIPKVVEMCKKANVLPEHLFSDPSIPPFRRHFKYKEGQRKLITASGQFKPISPSAQWHSVDCPASFYIIDAMCTYRLLRLAKQEERSYALDAILKKELGITKLKFKEADQYEGLQWHQFMQTNYKLEYAVYNTFDCISMLKLDEKIKDLSFTLPAFAGNTDFANFRSQPKRITDSFYFYLLLEKNSVLASAGSRRFLNETIEDEIPIDEISTEDEEDEESDATPNHTLNLKDWILTVPASMVAANGLQCIEEDPTLRTNIQCFVYDSDVSAAYPTAVVVGNVSKATTVKEIITIIDVDEPLFRAQNINCLSGSTNALEYCTTMFKFPKPETLLESYLNAKK